MPPVRINCAARSALNTFRGSPSNPVALTATSWLTGLRATARVSRNCREPDGNCLIRSSSITERVIPAVAARSPIIAYCVSCSRRNGLPPASRIIESINGSLETPAEAKSERVSSRASPPGKGPTKSSRQVSLPVRCKSCFKKGFDSMSSVRKLPTSKSFGASGGRSKSSSRKALSSSAHCRSSM